MDNYALNYLYIIQTLVRHENTYSNLMVDNQFRLLVVFL